MWNVTSTMHGIASRCIKGADGLMSATLSRNDTPMRYVKEDLIVTV